VVHAASLLILVLLAAPTEKGRDSSACRPASPEDNTIGGHMPYSVRTKGSVQIVQGTVVDATGKPIEGALVELFDHPEQSSWYLLVERDGVQQRIAACWTGASGRYRFDNVPAGHYDLRAGAEGFNGAFHWIFVDPKRRGKRAFKIQLNVGT
jgi:protocatechuate 3,4-dioxygenase beta subunit